MKDKSGRAFTSVAVIHHKIQEGKCTFRNILGWHSDSVLCISWERFQVPHEPGLNMQLWKMDGLMKHATTGIILPHHMHVVL